MKRRTQIATMRDELAGLTLKELYECQHALIAGVREDGGSRGDRDYANALSVEICARHAAGEKITGSMTLRLGDTRTEVEVKT